MQRRIALTLDIICSYLLKWFIPSFHLSPCSVPELHRQHCPHAQWCLCSTQWVPVNPASESGSASHKAVKICQTESNINQGNLNDPNVPKVLYFVFPNFQPCIAPPPSRKTTLAAVVGPRPHQQLPAGPAKPNQVDGPTYQTGIWSGQPPTRGLDSPCRKYHYHCFLLRIMQ